MNNETKQCLTSMGYRSMDVSEIKWGKPIGYNLIIYDDTEMMFHEYFYGASGQLLLWVSGPAQDLTLTKICDFEQWAFKQMYVGGNKNFAFYTNRELADVICGA